MSQLFALLYSGIVVTMGPCGIIIVQLSILILDLGTSVPLSDMPIQAPVGNIRSPDDQLEDVAVVFYVRLWDCGHNGYLWDHYYAVININPVSGNISTTIQTPEGEMVPITVSRSVQLIEVEDGWLNRGVCTIFCVSPEWVCNNHQVFYIPYYFSIQQRYLSRLFRTRHTILSEYLRLAR